MPFVTKNLVFVSTAFPTVPFLSLTSCLPKSCFSVVLLFNKKLFLIIYPGHIGSVIVVMKNGHVYIVSSNSLLRECEFCA